MQKASEEPEVGNVEATNEEPAAVEESSEQPPADEESLNRKIGRTTEAPAEAPVEEAKPMKTLRSQARWRCTKTRSIEQSKGSRKRSNQSCQMRYTVLESHLQERLM